MERPSATRIVMRTSSATAVIALLGVVTFTIIRGVHLQDWGLSTWRTQAPWHGTQQRLIVDSLDDLRKVAFFDPASQKAAVFYSINSAGEVELFKSGGRNPESGEYLQPITPSVVQQLERRWRQREQERAADAERKAATARADAEIARARRAQGVAAVQKRDVQTVGTAALLNQPTRH